MSTDDRVRSIACQFAVDGAVTAITSFGHGHINDSYMLVSDCGGQALRFLLQCINRRVFAQPEHVMDNIRQVTVHLRTRLAAMNAPDLGRRVLTLVPTLSGQTFHLDAEGDYWRLYRFIEGTRVYDVAPTPELTEHAGRAFGLFQQLLTDLPAARLHAVIPDFHDTPRRFTALEQTMREDPYGRAQETRAEIDFAFSYRSLGEVLVELQTCGELPARIAHNDAKISNLLFDNRTGEALCVTDLDTVMPGTVLYDFGDMVRSMSTTAAEDEPDTSRVSVDMSLFTALARGYLSSVRDFLTAGERQHLVLGGQVITLEQGVRFLTDYLRGDRYYRIAHPQHNLQRCRIQLRLAEDLIRRRPELDRIIESLG